MKLPALPSLKRDPAIALRKARGDLVAAETTLANLALKRQAALVETDELDAVAAVDAAMQAEHRTIGILRDRTEALARQVRQLEHEQRERERDAAIVELEKGFAKRHKLALEVEAAVKVLGDAWAALLDSRETALAAWPEIFPRPPAEVLRSRQMERELSWALFAAGRPVMGITRLPAPSNVGLGVTGISPKGIAGCVDEEHGAILQVLRNRPLPSPSETEEAA
jgi:hypothetical protein